MENLVKKRRRRSNFSQEEIEKLITLVKKRKDIIENKRNDAAIWVEKEAAWKEVEKEFNSSTGRELRDAKQLRFKYDALRRGTRKKIENAPEGYNKTSLTTTWTLTTTEKKLLNSILLPADGEHDLDSDQVMARDYYTRNECDSYKPDTKNSSTVITAGLELQDEVDIKPIVVLEMDDKPKENDSVDKLTEAKLDVLNLHKAILEQELAQKQEEFVHKKKLYEAVGVLNLLKIKILVKELEKTNNTRHL